MSAYRATDLSAVGPEPPITMGIRACMGGGESREVGDPVPHAAVVHELAAKERRDHRQGLEEPATALTRAVAEVEAVPPVLLAEPG